MYDQVLDSFRKATESTLQMQQDLFKSWAQQCFRVPDTTASPVTGFAEQVQSFQKQWGSAFSDTLKKHYEMLDTQYRAGLKTIDASFRLGDAKGPEQFRQLTEALWQQTHECLKTMIEAQMKDFQALAEKFFEMTKMTGVKP